MTREHYDVPQDDLDAASRIVLDKLNEALKQMAEENLDIGASIQAASQMTMRLYADLIDDDLEAIRQIRKFLDDWERDVHNAPNMEIH